jgi:hypothetical protein
VEPESEYGTLARTIRHLPREEAKGETGFSKKDSGLVKLLETIGGVPYQPVVQGSEFRNRERRRLIEWFASKDIEKIEDAKFRRAIRPVKALQQEKEAQKQLPLLVLPLPRLARTQQHP